MIFFLSNSTHSIEISRKISTYISELCLKCFYFMQRIEIFCLLICRVLPRAEMFISRKASYPPKYFTDHTLLLCTNLDNFFHLKSTVFLQVSTFLGKEEVYSKISLTCRIAKRAKMLPTMHLFCLFSIPQCITSWYFAICFKSYIPTFHRSVLEINTR